MILVFDLDDTLYEERRFVEGGFKAVAQYLKETFNLPEAKTLAFMQDCLQQDGRGTIFDDTLREFDCYSPRLVQTCLQRYRSHKPQIQLSEAADRCLRRFARFPIYVVTDGNKQVQQRKIDALKLSRHIQRALVTHCFGRRYAKPSPYCFQKICQWERTTPQNVVYIADNPTKDFVGIKPLGFQTIRIHQGPYQNQTFPPEYEADHQIDTLDALTEDFLAHVFATVKP